ncbi:MAG TPA: formyltransferase family protein, partial [Thermodesulfobacteriota bacterium]
MVNLGVLVSGSGSNLQAIIDNIEAGRVDAKIKIVISNVADVYALERARKHGIASLVIPHRGL